MLLVSVAMGAFTMDPHREDLPQKDSLLWIPTQRFFTMDQCNSSKQPQISRATFRGAASYPRFGVETCSTTAPSAFSNKSRELMLLISVTKVPPRSLTMEPQKFSLLGIPTETFFTMDQCKSAKQHQISRATCRIAAAPDPTNLTELQLQRPLSRDRCPRPDSPPSI